MHTYTQEVSMPDVKVRPIIKVWPLPEMTEDQYQVLAIAITHES